jgi:hypothetical protein
MKTKILKFINYIIICLLLIILYKNLNFSHLFSENLVGDEYVFYPQFIKFNLSNSMPYTYFFTCKIFSFLFDFSPLILLRFVSLFFYIVNIILINVLILKRTSNRIVFTLFCLLILENYPILYSATDDSTLYMLITLSYYFKFIYNKNNVYFYITLFLILLTKDTGIIFIFSYLLVDILFYIKNKVKLEILNWSRLIGVSILFFGLFPGSHTNKNYEQAPGYAKNTSWFDVRFSGIYSNYTGYSTKHRLDSLEHIEFNKRFLSNSSKPGNLVDVLIDFPKVFLFDKFQKVRSLILPHITFGLLFLIFTFIFLYNSLYLKVLNKKDLFFLFFLSIFIFYVIGYFENRWIIPFYVLLGARLINEEYTFFKSKIKFNIFTINIIVILFKCRYLLI